MFFGEPVPKFVDGFDHLGARQPQPHRRDHELFDFLIQEGGLFGFARRRGRCDHGADAGPRFEPAFGDQMLHHLMGGVRMDLEIGRKGAHRGERLPRLEFAADERFDRREDDLIEKRLSRLEGEIDKRHMCNVTLMTDESSPPVLVVVGLGRHRYLSVSSLRDFKSTCAM